jgi:tRNA nucleotidyltransferase (CCA-adding enzyme)
MTLLGKTIVLGPSRVVKVRLRCAAIETEPCAGPLRLETLAKVKLASKRFRVKPGKTATVELKLSKAKLKLVRKRKVKRVRAIATPRDRAGNSKPYKRVYRLKLAKKLRAPSTAVAALQNRLYPA